MSPLKKIEIIVEDVQIQHITQVVDELNLPGYTVVSDVSGRGTRGLKDGQGLDGTYLNGYIIVICSVKQAEELIKNIKPILEKYSGICVSSDVEQI
ncbi:MAG: hypothetical protein H6679_04465 [Epsilonproteobacteria bacterium]|nr:hypothetical protein [Campylobacterota bacterium]